MSTTRPWTSIPGLVRRHRTGSALAVALLGTGLALARIPLELWDSAYAEDGQVFLTGWADGSASLWQPYGGYLHLVPRAATWLVSLLPVSWWGYGVTVAACALLGAVCGLCYDSARTLVHSEAVRLAVGLAPVLAVASGVEALGNLADFHLYCLVALVMLAVGPRPGSLRGEIALAVTTLVLVLTEVQALLLAPVVAFMVWQARHGRGGVRRWGYVLGWTVGAVAQAATAFLVQARTPPGTLPVDLADGTRGYIANVVVGAVTGSRADAAAIIDTVGWWGAALVTCALLAVILRPGGDPGGSDLLTRFFPLLATGVGAASWYASYVLNHRYRFDTGSSPVLLRWGTAASVLLVIALLVAIGRWHRRPLVAAALVVFLGVSLVGFRAPLPYRTGEVAWSRSVAAATQPCRSDPGSSIRIPTPQPPGRFALVPCSRILQDVGH